MDLPTCPHCGQSVLDDDIDECPFCGESMSGKPAAKKPAPPKPISAPAAPKPEAKTAPQRSKPAKAQPAASPSEDQPFAVDQSAMANAIPLRPKPSPGRAFKVVCPMCETVGYTSPKAGGREVKCANPKCLVPLFTCPEPPPAPAQETPPEPGGLSGTALALISVVAIAAVGVGVWFFILKEDSTPTDSGAPAGGQLAKNVDSETQQKTQPVENDPVSTPVASPPKGPDLAKLRQQAADRMVEISGLPSRPRDTRPKPLRVKWTALAFAELGELEKAEQQLARLASFNDDAPHYRVLPWVEIGWKQREREESPADAANKALEFAKVPPVSEHESWQDAVSLSALLAATGRSDETQPLLNRSFGRPQTQELWSDMMAVTLDRTFNLEALEQTRSVMTPKNPAWSGVVWQLVFHEALPEGLEWAKRATDPQVKSEALLAWADAVVAHAIMTKQPAEPAGLEAAAKELPSIWPAVTTARAYARMGQRYAMAGNSASAESMLQAAQKALASLPKKEPMPVPDMKAIYNRNYPRGLSGNHIAATAFEVARLQATLNHTEEAWQSVEQGLAALRSETLPKSATEQLLAEIKTGADFLRDDLRTTLSLGSEDEARQAFRTYHTHVNELSDRSRERLQLQADLLAQAARWKLSEPVAQEVNTQIAAEGGDSYLETDLPWVVLAELGTENSEAAKSLETLLKQKRIPKPKGQALLEDSARWMSERNIPKMVDGLVRDRKSLPDPVRRRWILRLTAREITEGHLNNVLSFLTGLFNVDPFLGEDAAELIAGLATRNGQAQAVWQAINAKEKDWAPTQTIAAYRGFITAATPAPESESSAAKSP